MGDLGVVRGRAWRFGDNVDTDQMAPVPTFMSDWETTRRAMFPGRPGFAESLEPGAILVAGRNWGCGSSREQAPGNLKKLGVAGVVAESFGRIFYRNAVAIGLPALACPGVAEAVTEGDGVELDLEAGTVRDLTTGVVLNGYPHTPDMLRTLEAGGLLEMLAESGASVERPAGRPVAPPSPRPKTMAEKVIARAAGLPDVRPGEYVTATVDRVVIAEKLASSMSKLRKAGITELPDPDRVSGTLTGMFPAPTAEVARLHTAVRGMVESLHLSHFYHHDGILNQMIVERGDALPGQLIFGGDSHSTMYGGLGAAGSGLGVTELAYIMARGEIWVRVPETIRFELTGTPSAGVSAKDIVLHLLQRFGVEVGQYRALEFGGPAAAAMTIASRLTLANMGIELGAKFAMFAADEKTLDFLRPRTTAALAPFGPDDGATYAAVHEIDVSAIEPQVARPHNPGNVAPISEVAGTRVDQAFLGSCTNARLEDLAIAAAILAGRQVAPWTRLIVTPASREVLLAAERAGYVRVLLEAGAHLTPPGCGACPGGMGGAVGPGEVCISSSNRNFRGRMGSPDAFVYLASPATVAASAVQGAITDPRELWPANAADLMLV